MNIFDIMGPVMIGPSSSHTAGIVRIGNVIHGILGGIPKKINVCFYGSLAKTYRGHGADKAIIAGLIGYAPDDVRIRNSLCLAAEQYVDYVIETSEESHAAHPNTVLVKAETALGELFTVQGASIGGGNIVIQRINGLDVMFDGRYDTLLVMHQDAPGAVSLVTNVLTVERINIAGMRVYRSVKGGDAIMIIETDGRLDKKLANTLHYLPHVKQVTVINSPA